MLVLSKSARKKSVLSVPFSQLTQMVDRRLSIAQKGLAEARKHLAAGQAENAEIVLGKIDEDLLLLRCRLDRETGTVASHPVTLNESEN